MTKSKHKPLTDIVSDYRMIARQAYDNATDLREDARLLLNARNSPRAFSLGVACVEELMKAFIADLVSKGSAKPEDLKAELKGRVWPILTSHGSKHHLFALFLLLQAAKREGPGKVASVDKTLRETLTTDSIDVKGKAEIIKLVTTMEEKRQDSLYVGTKMVKGLIKTPKSEITREMCVDLLAKIDDFLPTVETNLKTSSEKYRDEAGKLAKERAA